MDGRLFPKQVKILCDVVRLFLKRRGSQEVTLPSAPSASSTRSIQFQSDLQSRRSSHTHPLLNAAHLPVAARTTGLPSEPPPAAIDRR